MPPNERLQHALALHQAGRWSEAETEYRALLVENADDVNALSNLGTICGATERLPEAIALWRRAAALAPASWQISLNLGMALAASEQFEPAVASYRQALHDTPKPAEVLHLIGHALRSSGRLGEARSSWESALSFEPSNPNFWFHHGAVCAEIGDFSMALQSARQALALRPDYVEALNLQGAVLRDLRQEAAAEESLRRAIELKPDYAPALNNYGLALIEAGVIDEAIRAFRRALTGVAGKPADHSNLLFLLNYSGKIGDPEIFAEHQRWAELYANGLAPTEPPQARPRAGRLKIGYVSADFHAHPASQITTAFLPHHDRGEFHIFAYSDARSKDQVTARIRSMVETWRPIIGRSDEQVAKLIRDDGIDILVDLSGHTSGGNRMLVFARQPAPVQATTIIYPNTTGLRTIQFRVTDNFLDPTGMSESHYTEKLVRLPEMSWCYNPRDQAPPVSTPPVTRGQPFTFGSLNNPAKVTDDVVALWSQILRAVPHSKLLIAAGRSPLSRARIESDFAKTGIETNRLEILNRMSLNEYLKLFERVDLALDPYPYNGVTTTSDTLWMGVPVVTLAGASCRARHGVCLLNNVGLTQFIAKDRAEYLKIATDCVNSPEMLQELRAGLRDRMRQSPIVRGDLFAARLEAAFRQIWTEMGGT